MSLITLTTDFGLLDGYVGVMKGVIWGIAPHARIVDITHLLPPQNVMQGAIALSRAVPFFPKKSIHVAVVDPGVGTSRRPIAAQIGDQFFVAPDNGILSLMVRQEAKKNGFIKFVHLENEKYWLDEISNVFHGRDIFSPVGAHLACGVPLNEPGKEIDDFVMVDFPEVRLTENKIEGEVISIDNFGNLATNIFRNHLEKLGDQVIVRIGDVEMQGLVKTFGEKEIGTLTAMIGTRQDLIIASVNRNAQKKLDARIGDKVVVERVSR